MLRILFFACVCMLIMRSPVTAQDPQFSQFYAAPLYLNPAFAGATNQNRMGINYRNQWPAIDANFTTISAFYDTYIESKNSGIGVLLTRDREGILGLQSMSLALQYSYDLKIVEGLSFRPGAQIAIVNRSINFDRLTFGDQFDPQTGDIVNPVSGEALSGQSKFFPDLTFGGLLYSKRAWLGFAAHHLTQPNQSIIGEDSRLPMKLAGHAGLKFYFKPGEMGDGFYTRPRERSIAPALQYRHQGEFDQMDVGFYFTFEPLIIGTWYRGVPFKKVNGFTNNESVVLLVGFAKKGAKNSTLNIGYSYDYTISKLGPASGGAHEFSLVYSWSTRDPRKPAKDKLMIPCPDF